MRLFAPADDWRHPIDLKDYVQDPLGLLKELRDRKVIVLRVEGEKAWADPPRPLRGTGEEVTGFPGEADPGQWTEHFHREEFRCGDGTIAHEDQLRKVASRLELLRRHLRGKRINITSGYRSPAYNIRVGGVANSLHTRGMAADIWVEGVSVEALARAAEAVGFGGIGRYPGQGFVHVDIGPTARWTG